MILSYHYTADYDPPAPIIPITLISLDDEQVTVGPIEAIVDSGADGTLIPESYLQAIQAPAVRKARIKGITGAGFWADIFLVAIQIGPLKLHGIRAIANPAREIVLGRNVLNQLDIELNGPAETVELHFREALHATGRVK